MSLRDDAVGMCVAVGRRMGIAIGAPGAAGVGGLAAGSQPSPAETVFNIEMKYKSRAKTMISSQDARAAINAVRMSPVQDVDGRAALAGFFARSGKFFQEGDKPAVKKALLQGIETGDKLATQPNRGLQAQVLEKLAFGEMNPSVGFTTQLAPHSTLDNPMRAPLGAVAPQARAKLERSIEKLKQEHPHQQLTDVSITTSSLDRQPYGYRVDVNFGGAGERLFANNKGDIVGLQQERFGGDVSLPD
jgi:hypothetical protein